MMEEPAVSNWGSPCGRDYYKDGKVPLRTSRADMLVGPRHHLKLQQFKHGVC